LTYLLFLKMAHEQTQPPYNGPSTIPKGFDWPSLLARDGDDLEAHCRHLLEKLGKAGGMLGTIFRKAQHKIQNPALLRRLIADLIDNEQWTTLDTDVKGDAYEGLLEKNAEDAKSGAGQYFTPRALIRAIVDVMRPAPMQTIFDPACGTGGFKQKAHLKEGALRGMELVESAARLCAMNFYLHGIGGEVCPVERDDSLNRKPSVFYDMVVTNLPFGKKSSVTFVNGEGEQGKDAAVVVREDFWAGGDCGARRRAV